MQKFSVTIQGTSLKRLIVVVIVGIIALFIVTGMLTSFEPGYGLTSVSVHEWANHLSGEDFVHVIGLENQYFKQNLPEGTETLKLSPFFFRLLTSINPDDPRSLLGSELPGFALYDGRIIVAGEGTDYTNMPIESAPPMEVLMAEREAIYKKVQQDEPAKQNPAMTTGGRKVVHIIHTHTRESFLPELKEGLTANEAWHGEVNVTLVGERMAKTLEGYGIGTQVDKTDFQNILLERDWGYGKSYAASREVLQKAITSNGDLEFFFDIHRDDRKRNITTVNINGQDYARPYFVIGENNEHAEYNKMLAQELHERLEKDFPGLSRGVIGYGGPGRNGLYNQDLSKNSLLIEMGGVENSLEEVYRTVDAIAKVFSEYYWQQQKAEHKEEAS
ncbi:MAG TPA: stage II sporulation protein P [Bacilli bacterium]|nr:stage II sporulation protein P [Bacilli bacterium]